MRVTEAKSEHYGYKWVDSHIHLDLYEEQERKALLREAFAAGMEAVVSVSMNLASSQANRELRLAYPEQIMPAYGFHPERPLPSAEEEEELFAWIRERHREGEPFAIGEVGLPYYTRTEAEAAGEAFDEAPYLRLLERFAALAAELERPIVLHAVYEDAAKACALLEKYGVRRAHFHWFKGPEETISRMASNGYFVSVTPDVAYEEEMTALVRRYPADRLMTETDGPWPFEGPYEGRLTSPVMAADVVLRIAELRGTLPAEEAARLLANAKAFYGIGAGRATS
ncbi:DNAase [Paenibacillus darwinianus]|uniref:DNAase n=1 Tax=Paenibacillus darwinianus TaxID=1380763 RepID=A0A9W5RYR6_9BACL|nr:DNAase [Paenibacillus darwinianus]EXX85375.1 DNAase [Paenibacillus darwinianus]